MLHDLIPQIKNVVAWGHLEEIYCLALSTDNRFVASGARDQAVVVWRAEDGYPVGLFRGHTDSVTSLRFSVDGQFLASTSSDHVIFLWDWKEASDATLVCAHSDFLTCQAYSPNYRLLAVGSCDGNVYIWKVEGGRLICTLQGHAPGVLRVEFSESGDLVATEDFARVVRVWDIHNGVRYRGNDAVQLKSQNRWFGICETGQFFDDRGDTLLVSTNDGRQMGCIPGNFLSDHVSYVPPRGLWVVASRMEMQFYVEEDI